MGRGGARTRKPRGSPKNYSRGTRPSLLWPLGVPEGRFGRAASVTAFWSPALDNFCQARRFFWQRRCGWEGEVRRRRDAAQGGCVGEDFRRFLTANRVCGRGNVGRTPGFDRKHFLGALGTRAAHSRVFPRLLSRETSKVQQKLGSISHIPYCALAGLRGGEKSRNTEI